MEKVDGQGRGQLRRQATLGAGRRWLGGLTPSGGPVRKEGAVQAGDLNRTDGGRRQGEEQVSTGGGGEGGREEACSRRCDQGRVTAM